MVTGSINSAVSKVRREHRMDPIKWFIDQPHVTITYSY